MHLHELFQTTCLSAYYDPSNDWLYLDWQGEPSLPDIQQACLTLAECYLRRPYSHILNNNEQVTGVSWNVAVWLATDFLPHMGLAGIEHVAWVYSSSLRGRTMVHTVLTLLPGSFITTFNYVADAVEWLQQMRPKSQADYELPKRTAAVQAKLAQEVQALRERIAARQRKLQRPSRWRRV
jgi:hypothetical protein